MDKEDLKRLADDNHYISGIYNYCDRWCERCPYTARCMNYAMGQRHFPDEESRDIENEAFWESMESMFSATLDLLREMAEEQGIDLDAISDEEMEVIEEAERREQKRVAAHELSERSKSYIEMTDQWFDAADPVFEKKRDDLIDLVRLNILGADPEAEAIALSDAVEVIRWYQYFIHVKLMRALHSQAEDDWFDQEGFPRDSDGSAKIALIAMDRSIAAWGVLLRAFPRQETEILQILAHLDRLRQDAEREFPQARAFVRPGFDEEEPFLDPDVFGDL